MSQKGFEKKLKISGVLDFTADFGLKVSQVTAGFGYGEGYYATKKLINQSFVVFPVQKDHSCSACQSCAL